MMGMNRAIRSPIEVIEVIAPSSHVGLDALTPSIDRLQASGIDVTLHPQTELRLHQSAGSAAEKAAALNESLLNPDTDAVLFAVGGNRAAAMLDAIDFNAIADIAKPVMGFSDGTSLLLALAAKTKAQAIHGPTLNRLAKLPDAEYQAALDALNGEPINIPLHDTDWIQDGEATGPLFGGNLSVFQSLIGTPYMPDLAGAILFFEDIGDELSRYDRMLAHIRLAGIFDQCAGVIFGDMSEARDTGRKPFGFTLADVVAEHCGGVDGPIILNAPFGHKGSFYPFILGCSCYVSRETLRVTP